MGEEYTITMLTIQLINLSPNLIIKLAKYI